MKLGNFVFSASAVILTWLVLTFIREVPSRNYLKSDKSAAKQAVEVPKESAQTSPEENEPALFHVSVSQ